MRTQQMTNSFETRTEARPDRFKNVARDYTLQDV